MKTKRVKVAFTGEVQELEAGIGLLKDRLMLETGEGYLPVQVSRDSNDAITVSFNGESGLIGYHTKAQFFRGLGLFVEYFRKGKPFFIKEKPSFSTIGVMLDVSRNAVPTVESIKRLLRHMALMGLNFLMLYAEDMYEIEALPYFGYMRGRYTRGELKECDDYADLLGIEIVPCIQTLGHLAQVLKWNGFAGLRDTGDILLAGCEETYALVELMIDAASAPFRSKRIHIGMDEAYNLGLGKYLEKNGFRRRFDIMNEHLKRVVAITKRRGLQPMIWSDMYFTLASKTGTYFDMDAEVPSDVAACIPKGVQAVYWDYYHNDEAHYSRFIRKHRDIGMEPVFAGGIWSFAGMLVNYNKTFAASNAALSACRKEGIREVFATVWNDDGAETNLFAALLGMQLFAEAGYNGKTDRETLKQRFEFCTGADFESFMDFSLFDVLPGTESESLLEKPSNPSKYLLWQDILIGLFDRHTEGFDVKGHYSKLAKKMEEYGELAGEWSFLYDMPEKLGRVLAVKGSLGRELTELYRAGDLEAMRRIADKTLPDLYILTDQLRKAHRKQWMETCKPFGWEVLDIRYGGLLARIDTARDRIRDYTDGKVDRLEELEEERLYFDGPNRPEGVRAGRCNIYRRIASASML
jgi:hexosaminidase